MRENCILICATRKFKFPSAEVVCQFSIGGLTNHSKGSLLKCQLLHYVQGFCGSGIQPGHYEDGCLCSIMSRTLNGMT